MRAQWLDTFLLNGLLDVSRVRVPGRHHRVWNLQRGIYSRCANNGTITRRKNTRPRKVKYQRRTSYLFHYAHVRPVNGVNSAWRRSFAREYSERTRDAAYILGLSLLDLELLIHRVYLFKCFLRGLLVSRYNWVWPIIKAVSCDSVTIFQWWFQEGRSWIYNLLNIKMLSYTFTFYFSR